MTAGWTYLSLTIRSRIFFLPIAGRALRRNRTQADVAYNAEGRARSGMGIDSADFNQDGWMDLFVANINQEIFSLYQNNRDETFEEAMELGIGMATRSISGWGLKFFDYDNDGTWTFFVRTAIP